jgi:hypothetical protein
MTPEEIATAMVAAALRALQLVTRRADLLAVIDALEAIA